MRLAVVLTSSLGLSLALLAACSEQAPAAPATPAASAVEVGPAEAPAAADAVGTDANTLTPEAISAMMVGEFRSTDDEKSTIKIGVDGTWTTAYEGAEPSVSRWRIFAGDAPPAGVTETFTPASRYLEVTDADGVFYYEMGVINHDGFDMFYKARGNLLSYVRVKAPG